jgi:hypothetical protein
MYGLLYECKFLTIEETNKKKRRLSPLKLHVNDLSRTPISLGVIDVLGNTKSRTHVALVVIDVLGDTKSRSHVALVVTFRIAQDVYHH